MRKFKKLLAVGACLCMSLSLLAGCGSGAGGASDSGTSESGTKQESTKSSDLSFAFCTNTLNNTFQSSIDAKLKELCDANGISYTCLDPDYDLNTQLSQLSDVANSGYDAVFIIPVDSAGITSGLAEIKDAGIPIFNVDTAVIEDDIENFVTQFVGTNAYMAGQLVGEQMAKDYPDGADIAILDFPSNESCVDRVNGFLDGLGDNKDKFNIVAQQDGEAALGAAAAVKAANKTGQIGVYSIDASPDGKKALLDGEFTAVACQVPVQIAEYAFNAAQKYVGGDTTIDEKKVYLDSHLVLKDEAEKTVNDWQ